MPELLVEIPKGSNLKLEYQNGLVYDRLLNIPMVENYGSILNVPIQTDGDPPDFYLITKQALVYNLKIKEKDVILVGVFKYVDNNDQDNKYLYCFKQEYSENENFLRYLTNQINSICSYLIYYKNETNIIEKLYLNPALWESNLILLERLEKNICTNIEHYIPTSLILKDLDEKP